jgi:hypothetical protein
MNGAEEFYPPYAVVCERCWLVQLQEDVSPEKIFLEDAHFSSVVPGRPMGRAIPDPEVLS